MYRTRLLPRTKRLFFRLLPHTLLWVIMSISAVRATPFMGTQLSAKPNDCVTLDRGRVCYQTIELHWQTEVPGHYCLWQIPAKNPLRCWSNVQTGQHTLNFASAKNQRYVLRAFEQSINLVSTDIEVKWVYKNRRRDRLRWRIF